MCHLFREPRESTRLRANELTGGSKCPHELGDALVAVLARHVEERISSAIAGSFSFRREMGAARLPRWKTAPNRSSVDEGILASHFLVYSVYTLYIYISSRVTTIEIKMGKAPAHAFRQACNSHSGVFPVMSYSWSFPTGRHCSITVPSTVKTVEILFARKRLELPWLQCFFRSGKSW